MTLDNTDGSKKSLLSFGGDYTNCFNHAIACWLSEKLFMGIGGGFNENKIFIINFESPGFETIAMAL